MGIHILIKVDAIEVVDTVIEKEQLEDHSAFHISPFL